MGKLKKLLGVSALVGVAICGTAIYKKKYGMSILDDNDFEDDLDVDIKDKKIIGFSTDGSDDNNKKVTISFNKHNAKKAVSDTLDNIGDAMYTAKDKVVDVIGEERIESAAEAVDKAKTKFVDTVGEDNINKVKEQVGKATDYTKEKAAIIADKTKEKASEIFSDENIEMAKEKMSNAYDKTVDTIKKMSDKVKNTVDEDDKDFFDETSVDFGGLDELDGFEDTSNEESEADIFSDELADEISDDDIEDSTPIESNDSYSFLSNDTISVSNDSDIEAKHFEESDDFNNIDYSESIDDLEETDEPIENSNTTIGESISLPSFLADDRDVTQIKLDDDMEDELEDVDDFSNDDIFSDDIIEDINENSSNEIFNSNDSYSTKINDDIFDEDLYQDIEDSSDVETLDNTENTEEDDDETTTNKNTDDFSKFDFFADELEDL